MPRIAVLADIHANVPALDAVIADIAAQHIDEVVVAGDLVGRGPLGSTVVRRIQALGWACVRGNHEDYLLDFRAGRVPEGWRGDPAWAGARWMAEELSEADAAFLDALPATHTPRLGSDIRIVHGTPASNREGIGPWTTDAQLAGILAEIEEPVLVCAHTHRPLIRPFGARLVVNTGSVGLPFNGDPRAQYVILDAESDAGDDAIRWHAEHRYVAYDREQVRRIYRDTGFLEAGGIVSALLALEIETARSVLVPYLVWIEKREESPGWSTWSSFLDEAGWTETARAAGIHAPRSSANGVEEP
jgi:putative phosphoesterase